MGVFLTFPYGNICNAAALLWGLTTAMPQLLAGAQGIDLGDDWGLSATGVMIFLAIRSLSGKRGRDQSKDRYREQSGKFH